MVLNQLSEEQALRKRREELSELEPRLAEREAELANLQSSLRAFEGRYLSAVGERYDELAGIEKEIAKSQGLEFDDEDPISLAEYCRERRINCHEYQTFDEILRRLQERF